MTIAHSDEQQHPAKAIDYALIVKCCGSGNEE